MRRFEGKVAVVTGATSGIGQATALAFAAEGAHLAIAGRREERLESVAAEAKGHGARVVTLAGDIRDEPTVRVWEAHVAKEFGHVDCLVQAAGVLGGGSIFDTHHEEWDRQMDTNVRGLFLLTQALAPLLKKGTDASIVSVSSVTSYRPYANLLAYCVSKAAVDMFTRCVALDMAPHGIRVNCVNPGVVRTELHTVTQAVADYEGFIERSKTTHPLGRVGQPGEIAASILFLCSKEAGWITGCCLPIDGGRGLMSAR